MKIAILVYSKTGTTLRMAKMILERLKQQDREVDLFEVAPEGEYQIGNPVCKISVLPDLTGYDTIICGGPVWAFRINPVIHTSITLMKDLKGKTFIPFVTMGFPLPFMGGNKAIKQMTDIARDMGAKCTKGYIVCKMLRNHEIEMGKAVHSIVNTL